ncbi:hypothetical protein AB8O64_36160 (plasmid) [Streptomyces sp. QH1-20]|uniref:hypothetical protein n=1 Tax=Streptomyces sp. QH1-20 TaxID=3240934 RepID=UPI0035197976
MPATLPSPSSTTAGSRGAPPRSGMEYPFGIEIRNRTGHHCEAVMIRAAIAVLTDGDEDGYSGFKLDPPDDHFEHPKLSGEKFATEISKLIERIEHGPIGERLVKLFARMPTLPDPKGDYGPAVDLKDPVNARHFFGSDGDNDHVIRLLIAPAWGWSPVTLGGMLDRHPRDTTDQFKAARDGRGAASLILMDPRLFSFSDERIGPPELILAHEMIHAVHALAGALIPRTAELDFRENDAYAAKRRQAKESAEAQAREELGLTGEEIGTLKRKTPQKWAKYKNLRAKYTRKNEERHINPFPALISDPGDPERATLTMGGVEMEEHETLGNPVTLAWIRESRFDEQGNLVLLPHPELKASIDLARAAMRSPRDYGSHLTPQDLHDCYTARQKINGITEVAIAQDMKFVGRPTYDPVKRDCAQMAWSPIVRDEIPDDWKRQPTKVAAIQTLRATFTAHPGKDAAKFVEKIDAHLACHRAAPMPTGGGSTAGAYQLLLCTEYRTPATDRSVPFSDALMTPDLVQEAHELIKRVGPHNKPPKAASPSAPTYV